MPGGTAPLFGMPADIRLGAAAPGVRLGQWPERLATSRRNQELRGTAQEVRAGMLRRPLFLDLLSVAQSRYAHAAGAQDEPAAELTYGDRSDSACTESVHNNIWIVGARLLNGVRTVTSAHGRV